MEPVLLPGRGRRDRRGMPGEDDAGGNENTVRRAEASVGRRRGGGALALGESTVERVGARGNRSECGRTARVHRRLAEARQGGRGERGAKRARGRRNRTSDR